MKRKKLFKIIVSTLMVTTIYSNLALGMDKSSEKEEVIYTILEGDGKVKDNYAVNLFNLEEEKKITDYGQYKNVINLSSTERINKLQDVIDFDGKKGKFYYKGDMESKDIPWDISLKYFFNDEEIQEKDLCGKNGKLNIKISIKQNKDIDESFFKNYALQMTIALKGEKTANVVAEGATIANVGSDKSLTYIQLPGIEKDYEISMDIKDFEMEPISINGILMGIDIDVDSSELTGAFDELKSGVGNLNNGASDLKDGFTQYKKGVSEISKKTDIMASSTNTFNKGVKSLDNGVAATNNGASELKNGVSTLAKGSSEYSNRINELAEKSKPLKDTTNEFIGIKKDVDGAVGNGLKELSNGNENMKGQLSTLKSQLEEIKNNITEESEKQKINETIRTINIMLNSLNKSYNICNSVSEKYNGLSTGLGEYLNGVNSVVDGTNKLASAYKSIDEGIQSTKTGSEKLYNGTQELKNGSVSLVDGSNKINNAANEFSKGSGSLLKGTNDLEKGVKAISNGTQELQNGTVGIDEEAESKINNIINKYTAKGYEVKSFLSEKNTNVKSVQFVMRTEGIKSDGKSKVNVEEGEKKGLIQRIIDLFKK